MKKVWKEPARCPVCDRRLNTIYPKEGEWISKLECPNKCYAYVFADGEHTVWVHTEGMKSVPNWTWTWKTSDDRFHAIQKKIKHACSMAKKVWDKLNKEAQSE